MSVSEEGVSDRDQPKERQAGTHTYITHTHAYTHTHTHAHFGTAGGAGKVMLFDWLVKYRM